MPHETYFAGPFGWQLLTAHQHTESESLYWFYLANPVYLHTSNVYTPGRPEAGQDPIRPYFGHWQTDLTSKDWDNNTFVGPITGWTHATKRRFIRPGQEWEGSPDWKAPSRTVATKKVITTNTYMSYEWRKFKDFIGPPTAEPGTGHGIWEGTGQNKKFKGFEQGYMNPGYKLFEEAAAVGPLPHYHEGYIDDFGNGFTTGVFISDFAAVFNGPSENITDLKLFAEYMQKQGFGTSAPWFAADPTHHTHKLIPFPGVAQPAPPSNIDNYNHEGIFRWDKYTEGTSHAVSIDSNGNPVGGVTIIDDDINEIIFLESAALLYTNKELEEIIGSLGPFSSIDALGGSGTEGYVPIEIDEAQATFNNHIKSDYKTKVHNYAGFDASKDVDKYSIFTDRAFDLDSLADTQSKGSVTSVVNFIDPAYKNALDLLPEDHHFVIPNSYLLGQFAENKERFYHDDGTDTIYGKLLTVGFQSLPAPLSDFSDAVNFPENMGLHEYRGLWIDGITNWKNIVTYLASAGIPSVGEKAKIVSFPKYEFLQEYTPSVSDTTSPWMVNITINVPDFSPFFFSWDPALQPYPAMRAIFIGAVDKMTTVSDSLMLFLMAQAAGNTLSDVEPYWKREYISNEFVNIRSWDLTQYLGKDFDNLAPGDMPNLLKNNNLISYDFGELEQWEENFFDIGLGLDWLASEIIFSGRQRSLYEILNPPLEWTNVWGDAGPQPHPNDLGNHIHPYAHSEIMFYEIEKRKGSGQLSDPILQRFFITRPTPEKMNSNEQSTIEYIDTQIKLNREYTYTVYSYVISIGNEYQYQDIQPKNFAKDKMVDKAPGETLPLVGPTTNHTINVEGPTLFGATADWPKRPSVATIYAINKPKVELLKIPYIKFAPMYISDSPPLHPNIEIFPYQGINNKLLFLLSQYVGEHIDTPIPILPGDKAIFDKIKNAQAASDVDVPEGKILFKSDEPDYKYQIFRLEKHPQDWSDFSTALRKELSLEKDFIDDIVPNKKYYYIFRTHDHHDNISNPSPIFEVELTDDSGAIYLNTKIVDFIEKVSREDTKSMRKYVHIVPTLKQSNLNTPQVDSIYIAEDMPNGINLGALFGGEPCTSPDTPSSPRTFKVRFTSKSSGKMFDLNLNFVHAHEGKDDSLYEDPDPDA